MQGYKLSDNEAGNVVGGVLTYQGNELDMTQTVAHYVEVYPELKTKLGFFYSFVASKTLQELCDQYTEEKIQGLIDSNS